MLIDSHCHLDFPKLAEDMPGVLARAQNAGVARMVNISVKRSSFPQVRATAEAHDPVYCSVGTHPEHTDEEGERFSLDEMVKIAKHRKIVGIGETGLDYFYNKGDHSGQQESFRQHIRAGMATDLPIIVHSRDAEEDTARILREEATALIQPRGVLHCFSSRRILAEEALALGFYISLSGILTFKKSQELRDITRDVPLDRILVETDSPYLAPEPYRGKTCEPAYVAQTASVLAEIKGVTPEEVARVTTENFFRLFNKVPRPA